MTSSHIDKHKTIQTEAAKAISRRAASAGDHDRQELRAAAEVLDWLSSQAYAAYESLDSPHDQYGNPTDYTGIEHQTMLRTKDHAEQLQTAAEIIRRVLDQDDIA